MINMTIEDNETHIVRRDQCPQCAKNGNDNSKDNLVVYSNGGKHCFACNYSVLSEDYREEKNIIYEYEDDLVFSRQEWLELKQYTVTEGKDKLGEGGVDFRGISEETYKFFGVRHEYSPDNGELLKQYYPLTNMQNEICGTKVRCVPKKFFCKGVNKHHITELFGQATHRKSISDVVIICSGELDALSAYEMLKHLRSNCPAIVSSTIGELGFKQYQAQYEFLNKFKKILVIPDKDTAGAEALKKLSQVMPRDKLFIVDLPRKDTNEMLMDPQNIQQDFVDRVFKAKPYIPDGIVGSSSLYEKLVESAEVLKIPLPPFMYKLEEILAGGFNLESIVNLVAASGIGKCLAEGTLVRRYDGSLARVENINVGERLLRPDGYYNTVLSVTSGTDVMYRVRQSEGEDYVVNSSHILSLKVAPGQEYNGLKEHSIINMPVKEFLNLDRAIKNEILKGWKASTSKDLNDELSVLFVEELPVDKYYGFSLDGDSLFCLKDYTVTHNSSYANELIYYWVFNSPYKVGIVSLELSAGQYANALLSRHMSNKLNLLPNEELKEFLKHEETIDKANELFKLEDATDRFYLIEDRSSNLDTAKKLIEQLIIGCDCKVIILDPLQDLFAGCSIEEQSLFMAWQKITIKLYNVVFINICHTRKSGDTANSGSTGAMISEEDILGTSDIYKSASVNLLLTRNKLAENSLERNTTKMFLSKNRNTGITGDAGKFIYDNQTHTLFNEEDHASMFPEQHVINLATDLPDNLIY